MIARAKDHCRNISWASQWWFFFSFCFIQTFVDYVFFWCSTVQAPIFLLLTCTSLRIVSFVGNSSLRGVDLGSCTMWNRRTLLRMYQIKSVSFIASITLPLTIPKVPELISQRRRWLNGSFFAAVHSTFHFHYLYRSSHGFGRKAWIHVELVYQVFNLIFSWFALVCLIIIQVELSWRMGLFIFGIKKGKLLYRL